MTNKIEEEEEEGEEKNGKPVKVIAIYNKPNKRNVELLEDSKDVMFGIKEFVSKVPGRWKSAEVYFYDR